MAADTPGPVEGFETWLLCRVAQAVEAQPTIAGIVYAGINAVGVLPCETERAGNSIL